MLSLSLGCLIGSPNRVRTLSLFPGTQGPQGVCAIPSLAELPAPIPRRFGIRGESPPRWEGEGAKEGSAGGAAVGRALGRGCSQSREADLLTGLRGWLWATGTAAAGAATSPSPPHPPRSPGRRREICRAAEPRGRGGRGTAQQRSLPSPPDDAAETAPPSRDRDPTPRRAPQVRPGHPRPSRGESRTRTASRRHVGSV